MPKTPSISSSFHIPTAISSFYTKQPLLAIATTIVLPILGILGLLSLRMKSDPTEDKVNEFTNTEKVTLKNALTLQSVDLPAGNRLLDRLSFWALKAGDLDLAYQSAMKILGNPDMRTYALCRMFNHLFNPKNQSEENWDATFINLASECKENHDVQLALNEKIFMRFLKKDKLQLAYDSFLRAKVQTTLTDHLSIQLFEACVEKKDQVLARKAVDNISDSELQGDYIQKYKAKWGTS